LEQPVPEVKVKAILPGQFFESSTHNTALINQQRITMEPDISEFKVFLENVKKQRLITGTGIQSFHPALSDLHEIIDKLKMHVSV
jgi:hypothetical protein